MTSNVLIIKKARLSYPNLFKPVAYKDVGKPSYSATLLIPKTSEAMLQEVKAALDFTAVEKWKDRAASLMNLLRAKDGICLRDGDIKADSGKSVFFAGHYYLNAKSATPVKLMQFNPHEAATEENNPFYPGCYVNAKVSFWAQDNSYGQKLNAQLIAVQFAGDADPFVAGATASADEFDGLNEDLSDLM